MGEPVHVLVVDDDEDVRELLGIVLDMEGFRVVEAANGRDALVALRELPRPAVMLLDLRMPVMTGWQVLDALRGEQAPSDVPIVICTSSPRDSPEGFPVLAKPVELPELVATIRKLAA